MCDLNRSKFVERDGRVLDRHQRKGIMTNPIPGSTTRDVFGALSPNMTLKSKSTNGAKDPVPSGYAPLTCPFCHFLG